MLETGTVCATLAIVGVSFSIAAAHGRIFARANLGHADAFARPVGGVALPRQGIAPQAFVALGANESRALFAFADDHWGRDGRKGCEIERQH